MIKAAKAVEPDPVVDVFLILADDTDHPGIEIGLFFNLSAAEEHSKIIDRRHYRNVRIIASTKNRAELHAAHQ